MKQNKIVKQTRLLSSHGSLIEPGYATSMLYTYNREYTKRFPFRLKEWNFYQFIKGDYVIQMTIGHISYVCSVTATVLNVKTGKKHELGVKRLVYIPKLDVDPEHDSHIEFHARDFLMSFTVTPTSRELHFKGRNDKFDNFEIALDIENDVMNEKMVIATPFKKRKQFYLNYKENYYKALGYAKIDDVNIDLNGATGLLDWGRGIWPYNHEWFWGSVSSHIDTVPFGINIGWGFGDLSKATENMYFYDKSSYKLGELSVLRDTKDYMKPWELHDLDDKIKINFIPLFDNYTENKLLIIDTNCHQIYGLFSGSIMTDDGIRTFKSILGFIEHAQNRW